MPHTRLDLLIAWLDAGRRRDRAALLDLLAPGATWPGMAATPGAIADAWPEWPPFAAAETMELSAVSGRAVARLRGPAARSDAYVALQSGDDGRVVRIDHAARRRDVAPIDPRAVPGGAPEAPVTAGVPRGAGWFVLNAADAVWQDGFFGAYTRFEGTEPFADIGVNIGVLEPGQPACFYHREDEQEDFLVLQGEALLLVEGQERRLRRWDFVHCPPWTNHVFVGAGDGPCALLALGGRAHDAVVYPVSDVALRHGAGVREQTTQPAEAYAAVPDDEPVPFDPAWLP